MTNNECLHCACPITDGQRFIQLAALDRFAHAVCYRVALGWYASHDREEQMRRVDAYFARQAA